MKRFLVILLTGGVVLASLAGSAAAMPDQQERPPTIFLFTSNIPSVTMADLEAGDLTITLGWHVAHVDQSHTLRLYGYQGYSWTLLHDPDQGLPAVGNLTVPLAHPGNFGSPAYKLVLLDVRGATLDERTLVIPFDREAMDGLSPVIESFAASIQSVDAAALAGGERVVVTWRITDRLPLTNLVFEQVIDDQVRNIELPRDRLWVPSNGTGAVVPVQPPNSSVITLQLRVLDVISAHVYDEQTLTISVTGSAIPPTAEPETEAPTGASDSASTAQVGNLTISSTCLATPGTATQRGWVDGDGIRSPDQQYIAYATNALGDAKLVIAQANGSGQIVIEAPDKAFPIGTRPVWSPDSQRIAFANIALSQPGGGTIYVVGRDGSDLRDIAPYIGYHDDLAWSEDGDQLYFSSGVTSGVGSGMQVGDYSVYEVAADGLGAPFLVSAGCAVRP